MENLEKLLKSTTMIDMWVIGDMFYLDLNGDIFENTNLDMLIIEALESLE